MSHKIYDLQSLRETVDYAAGYVRDRNVEGSKLRSRYLSLAVTDLESAENWINRAIAEAQQEELNEDQD